MDVGTEIKKTEDSTDSKIECHLISNTHWDREWRYSAQRTRYMLSYLMEMLFDIFEKEPKFKHFHLDSQTLPVQDYLEVFPDKAEKIHQLVSEGKLAIGPWFCLPDEFCVGGESLIRNLLLGHKIAKKFGGVSKTGYSPFGWGQISQLPQIYQGFGIDGASFYRGINTYIAPRSEFVWESPDGSRVIGSRLGARPRYNIWYIIQRPVYWNESNENNRFMSWQNGNGPFRFVDLAKSEMDYQYLHPRFSYWDEHIPARAEQAIKEQDQDWSTPHRFWSVGHDSSCPDIREARMIEDCNRALEGKATVFHSTVKAFQEGIKACFSKDWPVVTGEMRHPYTKGSVSKLMGWIISARTYIKQDNFHTERDLTYYAEPLAVFAGLLGAPYPQNFIDTAYNWLLQNHGHDSIGACGRDIIYQDMLYRSRQSREISNCILERAMMDIAGDINLSNWTPDRMAIMVYNPTPFKRTGVVPTIIEIPLEWKCQGFEIFDEQGEKMPIQITGKISPFYQVVQNPNDVANTFPAARYMARVEFRDIPSMGYRTFTVNPVQNLKNQNPLSQCPTVQSMENEYLTVTINTNGTLDIYDKKQGQVYRGFGYFKDSGEIGNPWEHIPPENDTVYSTINEKAEVVRILDGELETVFRITIHWALPISRSQDEKTRSMSLNNYQIVNTVTLRKGQRWIEIVTEIDNTVEDHYLQVCFPTGVQTDIVSAQGQFDVLRRPITPLDYRKFDEIPMTEHPMNSFVDLSDGQYGLALLNEGLKAYEVQNDSCKTICLTLLRCYPLRICVTEEMLDYSKLDRGSQCPGKQSFRYGIMPHGGDWAEGQVWQASESFNLGLQAAQFGPSPYGKGPLSKGFLELRTEGLHVSAVKRSESGLGWIIRLFNPFDKIVQNGIRLNQGLSGPFVKQSPVERLQSEFALPKNPGNRWSLVRQVTLEEIPEKDLIMDEYGWVDFVMNPKKILTIEFMP